MINRDVDQGRSFDFGKTSEYYAAWRNIYPEALFTRLKELGVGKDNSVWLDLGTGTGVLPARLYNANARIVGVDISEEQIGLAKA